MEGSASAGAYAGWVEAHAARWLPLAAACLRVCRLAGTTGMLRHIHHPRGEDASLPAAPEIARIVRGVARRIGVGCLPQSAVLAQVANGVAVRMAVVDALLGG